MRSDPLHLPRHDGGVTTPSMRPRLIHCNNDDTTQRTLTSPSLRHDDGATTRPHPDHNDNDADPHIPSPCPAPPVHIQTRTRMQTMRSRSRSCLYANGDPYALAPQLVVNTHGYTRDIA